MSKTVRLYGGVTYHAFGSEDIFSDIWNNRQDKNIHQLESEAQQRVEDVKNMISDTKLGDYLWNNDTKLLANFNDNLSGSNYGGSFENVSRFLVYKTIGDKSKLHKVCETETALQRVIEDFTVGDLCDYQYFVYAVCKSDIDINGKSVQVETVSPIISDKISLHNNIVSVMGLVEIDRDTYEIDENNIWHLQLNVTNDGYTLNTDKTFYQTQHAYGKASGGNRKQRSIPVSGLLGKIDCDVGDYRDTYDYIIDWETFAASNTPKMLIDLRGIISIGDIDINPSFSYEKTPNHEVSVSFTFNQTDSIDNVDVLGRVLPLNPLYYLYLSDSKGRLLKDANDSYLSVPRNRGV